MNEKRSSAFGHFWPAIRFMRITDLSATTQISSVEIHISRARRVRNGTLQTVCSGGLHIAASQSKAPMVSSRTGALPAARRHSAHIPQGMFTVPMKGAVCARQVSTKGWPSGSSSTCPMRHSTLYPDNMIELLPLSQRSCLWSLWTVSLEAYRVESYGSTLNPSYL